MKNLQDLTRNRRKKPNDVFNLLVLRGTLKKNWKHLLKKPLNLVKIEEKNQKVLKKIKQKLWKLIKINCGKRDFLTLGRDKAQNKIKIKTLILLSAFISLTSFS